MMWLAWTMPFQPLLADLRQLTIDLMGGYLDPADQWVRLVSSMDYSRDRGEQKVLPETGTRVEVK